LIVSLFDAESVGVQRSQEARLIGFALTLSVGKLRVTSSRPEYCVCEPPRLSVNGPRSLWKFACELIVAVAVYGLSAVFCRTPVLVSKFTFALNRVRAENSCWCCHERLVFDRSPRGPVGFDRLCCEAKSRPVTNRSSQR
jgi:hypothetical protein